MKKQINEINKNKKIAKYADFSTVLKWYDVNKQKIANILDVDVNELETEDNLIQQSSELINLVINPQSQGNQDINDQVKGFEGFNKIEKNLIHDILHNLYNVEMKKFNKSLEGLQFDESEIVEEIECLAIEESFMKFLNIPYLKSDFINTNINNLYSYLVLSILKNDPDRIEKYLEGKEKGYIEVYGKKYYTEGTPFEPIFTNLTSLPVNPYNIKSDDDYRSDDNINRNETNTLYSFKRFLINIIFAAVETGNNGDSREFPTGGYQSNDVNDLIDFEDYLKDENVNINERFENFMDFIRFLEDEHNNSHYKSENIKLLDIDNINKELLYIRKNLDKKEVIEYINTEIQDQELEPTIENKLNLYKNFIELKKEEFLTENYSMELYDYEYILKNNVCFSFAELSGNDNDKINLYKDSYNAFTNEYCAVDEDNKPVRDYTLIYTYLNDYISDYGTPEFLSKTNKIKVDAESSLKDIIKALLYDDKAVSYLRRFFRNNDWIVNNTKLGKEFGRFDNYISISKKLTTDNAKKLNLCLQDLLYYIRQNITTLKQESKPNNLFVNNIIKCNKILNDLNRNRLNILLKNVNENGVDSLVVGEFNLNIILNKLSEVKVILNQFKKYDINLLKNIPNNGFILLLKTKGFDYVIELIDIIISCLNGSKLLIDRNNNIFKGLYSFYINQAKLNPSLMRGYNYKFLALLNESDLNILKVGEFESIGDCQGFENSVDVNFSFKLYIDVFFNRELKKLNMTTNNIS